MTKAGRLMRLLKWIAISLLGLGAFFWVAAGLLIALAGSDARTKLSEVFFGPYPDGRDASWHTAGGQELIRANTDHFNIALQISRCYPTVNLSREWDEIPGNIQFAFMVNMQPNGEEVISNAAAAAAATAPDVKLTNFHRALLTVSRFATSARGDLAGAAAHSQSTMLLYQWMTVIIGAITTILVSVKSMAHPSSTSRAYFVIGILAVVFSATGTAVASISSFVGPNDTYVRAERSLIQVRQIHLELALQVAQETDLCRDFDPEKSDDARAKRFTDLTTRLREIVASSGASTPSQPGTASSTSSTTAATHR